MKTPEQLDGLSELPTIPFDEDMPTPSWESTTTNPDEEINRPVQYGACLWWSDELPCWVHPDDWRLVNELVPGDRIFKREECPDFADRKLGYVLLTYGSQKFRALPAIWMPVDYEGYEIGDLVEVKSKLGKKQPYVCSIRDIRWNQLTRRIDYFVTVNETKIQKPYRSEDFQPTKRLGEFLNARELELSGKSRIG